MKSKKIAHPVEMNPVFYPDLLLYTTIQILKCVFSRVFFSSFFSKYRSAQVTKRRTWGRFIFAGKSFAFLARTFGKKMAISCNGGTYVQTITSGKFLEVDQKRGHEVISTLVSNSRRCSWRTFTCYVCNFSSWLSKPISGNYLNIWITHPTRYLGALSKKKD